MEQQQTDTSGPLAWWKFEREKGADLQWRIEVSQSIVDRERSVAPALLMVLLTAHIALLQAHNQLAMALSLIVCGASLVIAHYGAQRFHAALRKGRATAGALTALSATLAIYGAGWACVLLSLDPGADPIAVQVLVVGASLISVTLVIITFCPILVAMGGFATAFFATFAIGNMTLAETLPISTSLLLIPLVAGPVLYGVNLANSAEAEARLTIDNRKLSARLLVALEKAQFLACHDPMTGLANRRAFFADYAGDLAEDHQRTFLFIDLDDFKQVNDRLGHEVGDSVLQGLAMVMMQLCDSLPDGRHSCVRLGGDEFVMVLDRLGSDDAHGIAETLRCRIGQMPIAYQLRDRTAISVSIGIAQQHAGETLDDVLQRSDTAMYRAKNDGRNQVTLAA